MAGAVQTWSSAERSRYRILATHAFGETEIGKLDVAAFVDQHVFWLDIAMYDLKGFFNT